MCGIAGFVTASFAGDLTLALGRALERIRHRGPDDEGVIGLPTSPEVGRPAVALACRRLAILDLTPLGHQPMRSSDGRWTVVMNGEIYNYIELRESLARTGVVFASHCDTEVLVEAWAAWGPDCLPKLQGMFALAAHDRLSGRVYLARDPFGIKPLYWAWQRRALVFASEISAVVEFPGVGRSIYPQSLHDFLTSARSDFDDRTLIADVRQVPPGHYIESSVEDPEPRRFVRYWRLDSTKEAGLSFDEAATLVRETFLNTVRLHLRSDVPIGFALSGGLDSSAVVMAAREALGPEHEMHTFTFVPNDPSIDEERHADLVARAAGAEAHKFRLTADDLRNDIDRLTSVQGEPFASPVIYAQYRVMQAAREAGMKVVLGGQGADEVLGGYDRYVPARLASLLKQGRLPDAWRLAGAGHAGYPGGSAAALKSAAWLAFPASMKSAALQRLRWSHRHRGWLDEGWFRGRGVEGPQPRAATGRSVMHQMLEEDVSGWSIRALMRYEDRSAMAHSLENRVPFLSVPLVELITSLPESYLLSQDATRKAVLRRALRGIVPDPILDRRDKIGFSVPTMAWLEALRPWVADRLRFAGELPGLVRGEVERRRLEVLGGREWRDPRLVWRWVSLATWVERFEVTL